MSKYLYGVHDYSSEWTQQLVGTDKDAWCVETLEIGAGSQDLVGRSFLSIRAQGVTVIGRLNYSHHGQGTIPLPDKYDEFAARCRNYVMNSPGCNIWIIGNEPNLAGERPEGVPITPTMYALCYSKCRAAIKSVQANAVVLVAALAPYNVDTGWCIDYWKELLSEVTKLGGCDGFAVHCYSRGGSPQSVSSNDKMDAPYNAYYNGFRAYRDFLREIPLGMRQLPVYITETDQNEPWVDANSGWVRAAYKEIDDWNKGPENQKIMALCLYRWLRHDKWEFSSKQGVVNDFFQTVRETAYLSPAPLADTVPMATPLYPAGANVRIGPGIDYAKMGAFAYGTKIPVIGRTTDGTWWQVRIEAGKGWVSADVVSVSNPGQVNDTELDRPPQQPSQSTIDLKNWIIQNWSRVLGIDPKLAQAIFAIESGGRSFEKGRMIIRFENHVFLENLKKYAPQLIGKFNQHFQIGSPIWTGHKWRPSESAPWDTQHNGGQLEEWQVFEFARQMHERAAMESISMGAGQIMGFNHNTVGYPSVQAMFEDYNNIAMGEMNQLVGFFAYIANRDGLLQAARSKNFEAIAAAYNGTGGVATYAPIIRNKYLELGGKL